MRHISDGFLETMTIEDIFVRVPSGRAGQAPRCIVGVDDVRRVLQPRQRCRIRCVRQRGLIPAQADGRQAVVDELYHAVCVSLMDLLQPWSRSIRR